MGADIESIMTGYQDSRLSKYFQPSELTRTKVNITSMNRELVDIPSGKGNYKGLSCPAIYAETPIQWMCAAETHLLRAEGAIEDGI